MGGGFLIFLDRSDLCWFGGFAQEHNYSAVVQDRISVLVLIDIVTNDQHCCM